MGLYHRYGKITAELKFRKGAKEFPNQCVPPDYRAPSPSEKDELKYRQQTTPIRTGHIQNQNEELKHIESIFDISLTRVKESTRVN